MLIFPNDRLQVAQIPTKPINLFYKPPKNLSKLKAKNDNPIIKINIFLFIITEFTFNVVYKKQSS